MSKIKETITALTNWNNLGSVRVSRKESTPLSDKRFELVLKFITHISTIIAATVLVLNAEIHKILALLVFGIFISLICFGMKD